MTVFISLLKSHEKSKDLQAACQRQASMSVSVYSLEPTAFSELPTSPFAYWLSSGMRKMFTSSTRAPISTRIGAGTLDDGRFLRAWWEVKATENVWVPFAKGGEYSRFYLDLCIALRWGSDGRELKTFVARKVGSSSRKIQSVSHYFRPGLYWSRRSQKGLTVRCLPRGCIFADTGPAAFVTGDAPSDLLSRLAVANSSVFRYLVHLFVGFGSYEVGVLQAVPIPSSTTATDIALSTYARSGWSLRRALDLSSETSHSFLIPAVFQVEGTLFRDRVVAWATRVVAIESQLTSVQSGIDQLCFELYGISAEDRVAIAEGFGVSSDSNEEDGSGGTDDADADCSDIELDAAGLAAGLVSWAIGVAVGRFDLRLATAERSWAEEPDPFDPLPLCSPGMLVGDDGLQPVTTPRDYRVEVSPVLVDDPGHRLDIVARVRSVFDAVFGEDADRWWGDVGVALRAKGGEAGVWLGKSFFEYHLKTYSKARRKAPILWPIGTRSGSYVVWLYGHRVSADSLFQVLNDIVAPKLAVEERQLTQMREDAGVDPTASQRRVIDAQEHFLGELREFREDLEGLAPLWAPDLNDGVVIVLAPLWRLFSHHRAWSNELKKHWAKLVKGDYDWAQLAMRLWPDRVIPKCAEDRSLAIAHGLEDVFWVEDQANENKWLPRPFPVTRIDQLIAKRHNPATSAALQRVNT